MSEKYNFVSYTINEINDFSRLLNELPDQFIYRGHSNSKWGLASTLERSFEKNNIIHKSRKNNIEKEMLDNFKRISSCSISNLPTMINDLEWTSLYQHHGGYTRLLDFTKSLAVASYFAVNTLDANECCIWCIDKRTLNTAVIPRVEKLVNDDINKYIKDMHPHLDPLFLPELERKTAEYVLKNKPNSLGVITVEPHNLNPRLIAQQGLFIVPFDINKTFMEHLTNSFGLTGSKEKPKELKNIEDVIKETKFIKIIIPSKLKKAIIKFLLKINITPATLFQGLDGLAKSINFNKDLLGNDGGFYE